ncbi:UNVERIFIED_CONTAM: CDGSH iron-sulfur domain-containing protein NEET [Sesamum latifolium]|uniref:CDGSH iron-sulfur domain-containing protein NEET n=1 Tax=Sesamum latifolium TaxID=2727402 RepID=A0AAW2T8H4_9LAMI
MVLVRAEAINPDIRKTEDKVVDSVVVADLAKPLTAYCRQRKTVTNILYELNIMESDDWVVDMCCRCWRSATFPLCDGSHVKHNKATGDNVGPLLLKKQ